MQQVVNNPEIIVVVEYIEVLNDGFVGDVFSRETHHLVEDRQSVAQGAVSLLGDDVQGLGFSVDTFALGYISQVFLDVFNCNSFEIKYLTAREDGRDDFVFLCGGKDELGVRRRLLQGLQEGVESILAEHVNLVDDVHLVLPDLRGDAYLLHQVADVVNRVVRCRVELVDVERSVVVERTARLAFVAGFHVLSGVEAVDGLGHDACASGLSYTSGSAEEVGLGERMVADGVLQRRGDRLLAYHRVKSRGPVFPC